MVGRKILLLAIPLVFLLSVSFANATDLYNCTKITASGTYDLRDNIDASYPSFNNACMWIDASNVVLNMHDFTITDVNPSEPTMASGITIDNYDNITILNGAIKDFNRPERGVGIYVSCLVWGCTNVEISNIKLTDNDIGLYALNVSNIRVQTAVDNPNSKVAINMQIISNMTLSAFARANTYALILFNVSNSTIIGHYDTNVIITENRTTILGWLDVFHLLPPSVTTETIQTQSKGMGIYCKDCNNTVFRDISALGLIQGIDLEDAYNNIIARVDLPLSGKYTGGKFGGVWLGANAKQNQLCEIKGVIIDFCNQLLLSSTCSGKSNQFFDTCENIFNPSSYGTQQSINNLYLVPLLPAIKSDYYPLMAFMTTPFFLIMLVICMISGYIAMHTKGIYGLYALMFMVVIFTSISFLTIWIGIIFAVIMAFMIMQYQKKQTIGEEHG